LGPCRKWGWGGLRPKTESTTSQDMCIDFFGPLLAHGKGVSLETLEYRAKEPRRCSDRSKEEGYKESAALQRRSPGVRQGRNSCQPRGGNKVWSQSAHKYHMQTPCLGSGGMELCLAECGWARRQPYELSLQSPLRQWASPVAERIPVQLEYSGSNLVSPPLCWACRFSSLCLTLTICKMGLMESIQRVSMRMK
jgi:hypothetical protein